MCHLWFSYTEKIQNNPRLKEILIQQPEKVYHLDERILIQNFQELCFFCFYLQCPVSNWIAIVINLPCYAIPSQAILSKRFSWTPIINALQKRNAIDKLEHSPMYVYQFLNTFNSQHSYGLCGRFNSALKTGLKGIA